MSYASLAFPVDSGIDLAPLRRCAARCGRALAFAGQSVVAAAFVWCLLAAPDLFQ